VFWYRLVTLARIAFQACSFIRLRSRIEFTASYGEMSRHSGEAAEAANHSDISPFRLNNLQALLGSLCGDCDKSSKSDAVGCRLHPV
jgi:hypothetical protein